MTAFRKQKESTEKSHEEIKAKTDNYKQLISTLNDKIPKSKIEFRKIIADLKDQVDRIQQTLNVDKVISVYEQYNILIIFL